MGSPGENPETSGTGLGIALMLAGIAMFSLNDALGKWLVGTYPVGELLALRSLAALALLAPLLRRAGGWRALWPREQRRLHGLRLLLAVGEVAGFYWSLRYLPLADVMTIYMAAPLFVTALSAPLLGERVGPRRWAATLVGFLGVLVVLRPSTAAFGLPALVALAGSLCFAMMMLLTRMLRAAGSVTIIGLQTLGVGLAGALTLPFAWVPPGSLDLGLLALLGLSALGAHLMVAQSIRLAPAAVVVPFQYTALLWAGGLGLLIWGDVPGPELLAGGAAIVASGLFILHRERVRRTMPSMPAEPGL